MRHFSSMSRVPGIFRERFDVVFVEVKIDVLLLRIFQPRGSQRTDSFNRGVQGRYAVRSVRSLLGTQNEICQPSTLIAAWVFRANTSTSARLRFSASATHCQEFQRILHTLKGKVCRQKFEHALSSLSNSYITIIWYGPLCSSVCNYLNI